MAKLAFVLANGNGKVKSKCLQSPRKRVVCPQPGKLAVARQVDFGYHLAREIRALGGQRLSVPVEQLYDRKMEELTSPEASRLIDLLKELWAGTKSLDDVLTGAAA